MTSEQTGRQPMYLNAEGSRWTYYPRDRALVYGPDGYVRVHNIDHYDAVGNFAAASVRVRRTRISAFPTDKTEDGLYVLDFREGENLKTWRERVPAAKERVHAGGIQPSLPQTTPETALVTPPPAPAVAPPVSERRRP